MADWYISPTGNDTTGNGSSGTPWKTLTKAHTSVTAGSTYQLIDAKDGAVEGTSGQVLNCQVNVAHGAAGTAYFDVFGYLK